MNTNLNKVLKYLKNNNNFILLDEDEDKIYSIFNVNRPSKVKWTVELKMNDNIIIKHGIITYDEYKEIKKLDPNTLINFGTMGKDKYTAILKEVIFDDDEDLISEYEKTYVSCDTNFLSYINNE